MRQGRRTWLKTSHGAAVGPRGHCGDAPVFLTLCGVAPQACCTEAGMFALRERRVHVTQARPGYLRV